jgi:hypothetical protein
MKGVASRIVVLVALFASGCHPVAPPRSPFPSAVAALARMKATYACERGVKGEARIDQFSDRGRLRGRVFLIGSRPDRLRFDVLSPPPFNSIVTTLTADAGQFALTDLREHKFYEGPASACNIARLTEVPLEAHVLVSLLGGQAPLLVHRDGDLQMEWNGGGYYAIRIPSTRDAFEEVRLAPTPADFDKAWSMQRVRVLDVRVVQKGIELYHASLEDHAAANTAPARVDPDGLEPPIPPSGPPCTAEVPRKIQIEVGGGDQDVLFRYDDVKLNPPLPAGAFAQEPQPGVQVQSVQCIE